MEAKSLNENYSVCGMTFDINAKTGRYKENSELGYWFYGEDENEGTSFQVTDVNLTEDIELKPEDRVSIATFGGLTLFLVLNHRNSKHKYYPAGVIDLIWSMVGCSTPIKNRLNARRLRKASSTFTTTQTYSNVLRKLQTQ